MMIRSAILLFLWPALFLRTKAEVYSSINDMQPLIETQKSVIRSLEAVVGSKKCKIKTVKKYLENLRKEYKAASANIPYYLGNPINSFKLIKSLTIDLNYIEDVLNGRIELKNNKSLLFPKKEDFTGAVMALLRVSSIYNLNGTQLSEGLLASNYSHSRKLYTEHFIPMTIGDCFELGMGLYKANYYDHGLLWMHEALRKYENEIAHEDHRYSRRDIVYKLNYGYDALDRFIKNFEPWIVKLHARYPTVSTADRNQLLGYYRRKMSLADTFKAIQLEEQYETKIGKKVMQQAYYDEYEENLFFSLCRNEIEVPIKKSMRLKCYYKNGPHPFLRLARVKTELLHRSPDVILYHDVISDAEIQQLKEIVENKLERCEVYDGVTHEASPDRVCKGVFLNTSSPFSQHIRRRISHFTDLDLIVTERLEVTNYGIGGHFAPHYDFWIDDKTIEEQGNRIATVVFYLSDVEQGGVTAFPPLRLTVFPVKGAALFWMNLLPSGESDFASFHTGCPVLRGSKWIMTQWINTRGQELSRPCPTNFKKSIL